MQTLCFTGHRQINGLYHGPAFVALKNHLIGVVERAITKYDVTNFISGLAMGVDTEAAEAVLYAQAGDYPDINLIGARPFPSMDAKWNAGTRARYAAIVANCDVVNDCFPDPYKVWKMQGRNIWMVNNSNIVVAVWNGVKKGGTWNCLEYAFSVQKKRAMKILVIHPTLLTEVVYSGKIKQEAN
jgi:uncharacterized phage-like protein YoqJ